MFLQHFVNALSVGSVYALLAIGYNMVYGNLEQLNFAHGDVYAVGCFAAYSFFMTGMNPIFAILAGAVSGFFINIGVEHFAYRPLRTAGRIAPTISTVGIAYIMRNMIQLIWGAETYPFDLGIFKNSSFKIADVKIGTLQIFILLFAISLMILISLALKYSKWDRRLSVFPKAFLPRR